MRSGVVLVELLVAISVAAILALFAVQSLAAIADGAAVRQEVALVVDAIDAARTSAVRLDANAALTLHDSSYDVTVVIGADTVPAWHRSGPALRGVAVAGTGRPIEFGPAGVAMGAANRTIVLSRRSASRSVVISRLGRLRY